MRITSKYRKEYYQRSIFLIFVLTIILGAVFQSHQENASFLKLILIGISAVSLSTLCLLAIHILAERNQLKIEVGPEGIYIFKLMKSKPNFIRFEDILSHESVRIRLQSSRVPISDGFLETTFTTKGGKELVINQDKYENYALLVRTIIQKLNSHVA